VTSDAADPDGPDTFGAAPTSWLRRLTIGFSWMIAANASLIVPEALFLLPWSGPTADAFFQGPGPTILFVVMDAVGWVAAWYLTTPEPTSGERHAFSLRQTARILATAAAVLGLILLLKPTAFPVSSRVLWRLAQVTLAIASTAALYVFTQRLATRAGRNDLSLQFGVVMTVTLVCLAITTGYSALWWAARRLGFDLPQLSPIQKTPRIAAMLAAAYACYLDFEMRRALAALIRGVNITAETPSAAESPTSSAYPSADGPPPV
jgi:hypothetical protein